MDSSKPYSQTLTVQVMRNGGALACYQFSCSSKKLLRIGRWPKSDIRVDDPLAAHLHAILEVNRFRVTLRDMGSDNPVMLNGQAMTNKADLSGRNEIRIGETVVCVDVGGVGAASSTVRPVAGTSQPTGSLECLGQNGSSPTTAFTQISADSRRASLAQRVASLSDAQLLRVELLLDRMDFEAPTDEKYDTRNLVRRMQRNRSLGHVAAGIGIAIGVVLIVVPFSLAFRDKDPAEVEEIQQQDQQQASLEEPQKTEEPAASAAERSPAQVPDSSARFSTAPSYDEYTVRRGDTLGRIARRTLGDADRWKAIFKANRDRLESPANIVVGTRLRIPRQ